MYLNCTQNIFYEPEYYSNKYVEIKQFYIADIKQLLPVFC